MTVLLVGEDNPYGSTPEFALYPSPRGCSGHRLMEILGLAEDTYCALHRTNLCDSGAWSMREAKRRAALLGVDPSAPWRVVVMLGRKVADAFGYTLPFFTSAIAPATAPWPTPITLVSLMHPSGRVTAWNRPETRTRARQILRELAPSVPWGPGPDLPKPEPIGALIERSSIGGALRDITDRGLDAHLVDLEHELTSRRLR